MAPATPVPGSTSRKLLCFRQAQFQSMCVHLSIVRHGIAVLMWVANKGLIHARAVSFKQKACQKFREEHCL